MLTHKDVWLGIDRLAAKHGYSASGLAKRAGLDPTTFNKSKRATSEGKARWPSTESIAKILEATTTTMAEFVAMMNDRPVPPRAEPIRRLRSLPIDRIDVGEMFDASGFPQGTGWEEVEFPSIDDDNAYALELVEDVAPPYWRRGDIVVVSPVSSTRRGDRVILCDRAGQLHLGILARRTAQRIVLEIQDPPERSWGIEDVAWVARIVWLSQ